MDRGLLRSTALSLAFACTLATLAAADGGKAKNEIYEARVPAQSGAGTMQFTIDTSPIVFYLTTVNAKYHVLLLRVKNQTRAPLMLSKEQDTAEFTFANGQKAQGLLNIPAVDRVTWDGLESEIRTAVTYPDLVPAGEEEGIYVYVRIADVKAWRLKHEMPMALTLNIKSLQELVQVRRRAAAAA
jgi:hypothetical protein